MWEADEWVAAILLDAISHCCLLGWIVWSSFVNKTVISEDLPLFKPLLRSLKWAAYWAVNQPSWWMMLTYIINCCYGNFWVLWLRYSQMENMGIKTTKEDRMKCSQCPSGQSDNVVTSSWSVWCLGIYSCFRGSTFHSHPEWRTCKIKVYQDLMLFGSRFEILPPHVGGAEACTLTLVYPRVNCAQFSGKHCVRMEEWEWANGLWLSLAASPWHVPRQKMLWWRPGHR